MSNTYTAEQINQAWYSTNQDMRGGNLHMFMEKLAALSAKSAVQEQKPAAWISTIMCIGPDYGKELYGKLPIQSLQAGYYKHTPLYTHPSSAAQVEEIRNAELEQLAIDVEGSYDKYEASAKVRALKTTAPSKGE